MKIAPVVVGVAQKVAKDVKNQAIDVGAKAVEGFVKAIRKKWNPKIKIVHLETEYRRK